MIIACIYSILYDAFNLQKHYLDYMYNIICSNTFLLNLVLDILLSSFFP